MKREIKQEEITEKKVSLVNIAKVLGAFAGAVAVFVPLYTGILNYEQSVRDKIDGNFRTVVENLSSPNEESRLAAATSLGTFLHKKNYYNETIDILTNRVSVELSYNVMNAILGSLKKAKKEEYKDIVQKVLIVDRNLFIQEYAIGKWKQNWEKIYKDSFDKYLNERKALINESQLLKSSGMEIESAMLNNLIEEMHLNWEISFKRGKDFIKLPMHKQFVADFISSFLGEATKLTSLEGLVFNQNALNHAVLTEIDLSKSTIKNSALSQSIIDYIKFDESEIRNTVFTDSDLKKCSFKECNIMFSLFDGAILKDVDFSGSETKMTEFKEVFFAGSNLSGANFKNIDGIKPIYFYGAKNVDEAIFDDNFKNIPDEMNEVMEDEFIKCVLESELTKSRKHTLLQTIDLIRKRYDFFTNASIAYTWFNDKNSKLAAIAAYMVASNNTITSMNNFITKVNSYWKKYLPSDPSLKPAIDRLLDLKGEIESKKWDLEGIMKDKEMLRNADIQYLNALESGDSDVFIRKYSNRYNIFEELKAIKTSS